MMATSNGKVEAANTLLEAGADMNLQSNDVSSMLNFAVKDAICVPYHDLSVYSLVSP